MSTHAAIHRCGWSSAQFAGDTARRLGVDAAHAGNRFGGVGRCGQADFVNTADVLFEAANVYQVFVEQRVDQREEPVRICAWSNRQVLGCVLGGFGSARVDDNKASSFTDCLESPRKVGRRNQAAVGRIRVRAEHEQVVGAIEVGEGKHVGSAPHQPGAYVLWHLVDRRGRKDVCAACGFE